MNWGVRMFSELENHSISLERIKEYIEMPIEAPWKIEDQEEPENWPHEGRIEFQNYKARYRDGLELVLNNICFETKTQEKIGICGRTGIR